MGLHRVLILISILVILVSCQFDWIRYDKIDEVFEKINAINADNCAMKQANELQLPEEIIYRLPSIELLKKSFILSNRTQLLHTRNLAHKNSILYSFLLQNLFDFDQPGLFYYYLHGSSDISGSRGYLNASGIIYDTDKAYAHWYKNYFNKTVPRFGPYAWRSDDFYDAFNWRNEWTNQTIRIDDLGAGRNSMYTSKYYKGNDWYFTWLPDPSPNDLYNGKVVHYYQLTTAKELGKFDENMKPSQFYGPPGTEDDPGPTKWTKPYFDCGRSNKWVISAVAPVVDVYPRHTEYRNVQSFRYLAIAVSSIDFIMMDINQCDEFNVGQSTNNGQSRNYFAGTHKCKPTTRCEPLNGFGFRRGGYQCMCQPGYRYPPYQNGPFKGEFIEKATKEEYEVNFDCIKVDLFQQVPLDLVESNTELISYYGKRKRDTEMAESLERISGSPLSFFSELSYQNANENHQTRVKRFSYEPTDRIDEIFDMYERLASDNGRQNCLSFAESDRRLPGDVIYGVESQFESQARLALSISHFLSSFYQLVNPEEDFPLRNAEKTLSEEQLYGEVISAVGADFRVVGIGIFFDRNKFKQRSYFGPYAFRVRDSLNVETQRRYQMVDFTGFKNGYHNEEWFTSIKSRWATNPEKIELEEFFMKPYIRGDYAGKILVNYESGIPQYYYAPKLTHGQWFPPVYQCDELSLLPKDWIVTYSVPFFGRDKLGTGLEFLGVVRVDVKLEELDINQCSMSYHVANAFKDTDRCDYLSTVVSLNKFLVS